MLNIIRKCRFAEKQKSQMPQGTRITLPDKSNTKKSSFTKKPKVEGGINVLAPMTIYSNEKLRLRISNILQWVLNLQPPYPSSGCGFWPCEFHEKCLKPEEFAHPDSQAEAKTELATFMAPMSLGHFLGIQSCIQETQFYMLSTRFELVESPIKTKLQEYENYKNAHSMPV